MDPYESTFPLDPSLFPYTKATAQQLRESRKSLDNALFFDLVLTEVAQVREPARLYPPRSSADVRALHEAIERCPVDLLKKQCCIYYILRDWNAHEEYASRQHIPHTYRALMDSYWHLDRADPQQAYHSLCSPGLTPNFAGKILRTVAAQKRSDLVVLLVQTLGVALDADAKLDTYLQALARVDLSTAFFYTRRLAPERRRRAFELVLREAVASGPTGLRVVADFPFHDELGESAWVDELLPTLGPAAVDALAVRQAWLGRMADAYTLRDRHGVGWHSLKSQLYDSCVAVEQKQLRMS